MNGNQQNNGNSERIMVHEHSPDDIDPDILFDDQINDDWMEGLDYSEFVASDDIDDVEEVDVRWDKEHDFCTLYNEYEDDFSLEKVEEIHKNVMKTGRIVARREVSSEDLNFL